MAVNTANIADVTMHKLGANDNLETKVLSYRKDSLVDDTSKFYALNNC